MQLGLLGTGGSPGTASLTNPNNEVYRRRNTPEAAEIRRRQTPVQESQNPNNGAINSQDAGGRPRYKNGKDAGGRPRHQTVHKEYFQTQPVPASGRHRRQAPWNGGPRGTAPNFAKRGGSPRHGLRGTVAAPATSSRKNPNNGAINAQDAGGRPRCRRQAPVQKLPLERCRRTRRRQAPGLEFRRQAPGFVGSGIGPMVCKWQALGSVSVEFRSLRASPFFFDDADGFSMTLAAFDAVS